MAVIYYLNWDRERENHGPASELFHKVTVEEVLEEDEKPRTEYQKSDFDALYREVATVNSVEKPEEVWKQWNRGSRQESQKFLGLRYCEQCDSYIEGSGESVTHAVRNHGYEPDDLVSADEPGYIHGVRSMSAGDIVEIDDTFYQARGIGWEEIEVKD